MKVGNDRFGEVWNLRVQGQVGTQGSVWVNGVQAHPDYVFEPDYPLESIENHAAFMWREKHLPAVPKAQKDTDGQASVELIAQQGGILEELEKAHIYIATLNEQLKTQQERLEVLEAQRSR